MPYEWTGAPLRRLRESRGLSQAGLAEAAGVKPAQVGHWEQGQEPRATSLVRLADALDATLDEVVGR